MNRFVQIHTLSSYSAVLLNRDDAGLAKRLPYGGASRIRISSQCLKRHWRKADNDSWALAKLDLPMAERSRMAVERIVMPALGDVAPDVAKAILTSLVRSLYGKDGENVRNRQALLLGHVELDYLKRLAREAAETGSAKAAEKLLADRFARGEGKANLKALTDGARLPAGLEAALFGRMVTSDPEANTDAAIHVAHAFTVHAEESESDYFTVVDDLTRDAGETGSAGLFETELTSGTFYGYVVVGVAALVSNLGGDAETASRVVEHLLHLIATVSPGAKRGSTAPGAYAELMLVEAGDRQPRSLAGAFRKPVTANGEDMLVAALRRLGDHVSNLDRCYGAGERRAALCIEPEGLPGVTALGLDDLARWAGAALAPAVA